MSCQATGYVAVCIASLYTGVIFFCLFCMSSAFPLLAQICTIRRNLTKGGTILLSRNGTKRLSGAKKRMVVL